MAGHIQLDVAILGGGFAGVYCAQTLAKKLGRNSQTRVGLISEDNFMVFQPMLPEVAGASISPRHAINALRLLCPRVDVFRGSVTAIDLAARRLTLNAGDFTANHDVEFGHLVLALGSVIDLSRVPGMGE